MPLRWLTLPEYFQGEFASQLPLKCKSCSPLKILLNSLSKDKNCLLHWVLIVVIVASS
ncbi:hypothetical protein HH620_003608 [Escherichia coli]|nr:hypothetical protein EDL933_3471 [Escherichia coli O157:H7 str. EDL933]EFH1663157.1 hypothetical protein [Escherichia coli]EFP9423442.1 hypothetical protein [Shigella dysenteriae]EFW66716.1 conserved domain protein [Escherichia coli O157:H7 str. EC1212]EFH2195907.1 hypothetical protein [Escherichia coli]